MKSPPRRRIPNSSFVSGGLRFSNPFDVLWKSRKFWLAVIAVAQTIVFTLVPGFPDEVWQAINVILLFLIGVIAAEDVAMKVRR